MAHLIDRLDALIAQAEGVIEREHLKARRAAILARHGQFADARFALAGLRSQSQRLRNPALAAWIALVDGLIDHCESLSPGARDKFRRAYELASSAGDAVVLAESAAWLACTDLNACDMAPAASHAAEALRVAPADCHTARARASLVVGDGWAFAGDDTRSQRWYPQVRQHAAAEGDVSLVSMMLYNRSAFRACRIGLDDAFGRADLAEAQRVLLEAESTGNYDAGVGNAQLTAQVPLLRAQLLVVMGRWDEAVTLIDAQLAQARSEGLGHREARFLVDAALAEVKLGRTEEAVKRVRFVLSALPRTTDDDDLAATHARLAAVLRGLGRDDQAEIHQLEADAALARHATMIAGWVDALCAAGLERPA
jgi:tetratricopeptide (TPR) repeat protein